MHCNGKKSIKARNDNLLKTDKNKKNIYISLPILDYSENIKQNYPYNLFLKQFSFLLSRLWDTCP